MNEEQASDLFFLFYFLYNFQPDDSLLELLQNLVDIDITFQELKVIINLILL